MLVPADALQSFAAAALAAADVPADSAAIVAAALVESDLAGHDSHGVRLLPTYVKRVFLGGTVPDARPAVVHDFAATAVVDGGDGWGPVNAAFAMDLAMVKARVHGLGLVAVRRSGHLGRLGHYTLQAAARGMVGLCMGNAGSRIAPWGGREPFLGNNPWSVAVPAGEELPVVVDMANSVVAAGKIRQYLGARKQLPEGWALDPEGNPTTDPVAALAGMLLPMAGHKGYGLMLTVDLLAGVLPGGAWGPQVRSIEDQDRPTNSSHLLLAIDPACFGDPAAFRQRMDEYIQGVKAVPPAAGAEAVLLPGERSLRTRVERLATGIRLNAATQIALAKLAADLSLQRPW